VAKWAAGIAASIGRKDHEQRCVRYNFRGGRFFYLGRPVAPQHCNKPKHDRNAVTQCKRPNGLTAEPKTWWQRVAAGERLPGGVLRAKPKCEGTVEDHRAIALDARELTRKHVFERPVGSLFHLNLRFPWLRVMRLNSSTIDLELVTGRTVVIRLVWASCGVTGERMRLECPLCGHRVCTLYHLDARVACRHCNNLWYAAQRISSTARKFMTKRKIRRKLGDYGQVSSARLPPKPRGMWRRTYTRHCAALARIERKLGY
jgi:ribosomal protein S27E